MNGSVPSHLISHPGFRRMFVSGRMTLGMTIPMESLNDRLYPRMDDQVHLARTVEYSDFAAIWFRDVPLYDPDFADMGQVFDIWIWLATINAHTLNISLSTGALVLPLRHPLHTAIAAVSLENLSGGRFLLGTASGDREIEYLALDNNHAQRGEAFREHLDYFKRALSECVLPEFASDNTVPVRVAERFKPDGGYDAH